MHLFSSTVDYSLDKKDDFYGEPTINYGSGKDDTNSDPGSVPPAFSGTGGWDDYQRELVQIVADNCQNTK